MSQQETSVCVKIYVCVRVGGDPVGVGGEINRLSGRSTNVIRDIIFHSRFSL